MKKIIRIISVALLFIAAILPGSLSAQQFSQNIEQRDYVRRYYQDYSRWSIGMNGGISAMWGDLRSFADGKTYIGGLYGLQVGYQLSPTFGFSLTGEYGHNKLGATSRNSGFRLDDLGFTYHGVMPAQMPTYGEIYSRVESWQVGLTVDINVNNLIAGNDGMRNRKWTVIASPGIYGQLFDPVLKAKNGTFSVRYPLYNNWNLGLGGDLALRWKASKCLDLQLKTGARWIDNANFDGIHSAVTMRNNGMAHVSLGLIWKMGWKTGRSKPDHMLYAKTRRYVRKIFPEPTAVTPAPAVQVITNVERVEVPVERIVHVTDLQMPLPTVHFERNSSVIDEVRYAAQLQNIMAALRAAPQALIQIWGYADHTGTPRINDPLSLARAEALRDYLIRHGIPAERITRVRGLGADPGKTGQAALSIEARRAEVVRD